jgi:hypothetical protein
MQKYLQEKLEEARKMSDFYEKKYLITQNSKYKLELKRWLGKEEAYYDCQQTYFIKQKNNELDSDLCNCGEIKMEESDFCKNCI